MRDKRTGAHGHDAQNTRLEVQHNFKEIANRRYCDIIIGKWQVKGPEANATSTILISRRCHVYLFKYKVDLLVRHVLGMYMATQVNLQPT